jgi:hypothetical protein
MDLKALDQATDYRAVFLSLFGGELKGEGAEVYAVPPMRPDEGLAPQRFSFNTRNGCWKDHKTGEHGNMLTLAKQYGPQNWRQVWIDTSPAAAEAFGPNSRGQAGSTRSAASPSKEDAPTSKSDFQGSNLFKKIGATGVPQPKPVARAAPSRSDGSASASPTNASTFGAEAQKWGRLAKPADFAPFCEAWGVDAGIFESWGCWVWTASKGRYAGKPILNLPMICPTTGTVIGIKQRGLEPIFRRGGDLLKSANKKGSKIGLIGWGVSSDLPVLIVEGEKDGAVAVQEFGKEYDVLANPGGASTFKRDWVKPIQDRWKKMVICYDDDAAGQQGAKKACVLLRGEGREVRNALLGMPGCDLFDLLRGGKADAETVRRSLGDSKELGGLDPYEVDGHIKAVLSDEDLKKDDTLLSNTLFDMMREHGALFYQSQSVEAYCSWRGKVFHVTGSDPAWNVLIAGYTGFMYANAVGRKIHENVKALACFHGTPVDRGAWCRYQGEAMFLPLYNERQDILRISTDGLEVVPNGYDDIVFMPNPNIPPITFIPDDAFDFDAAQSYYGSIWDNLNCSAKWQELTAAALKACFLYEFQQTHPHIRFQGPAGSGKSTAEQFISLVLYGTHNLIGNITFAALSRLSAAMPIICMDDFEDRDIRRNEEMGKFFLRAAVGGKRFMAGDGTQAVVTQDTKCWVMTNGIHSIAEDNPALNERLLVIPLRSKQEQRGQIYARDLFDEIQANRDIIMNYLYREVQRMLMAVQDGAMRRVLDKLPRTQRSRLHEFYACMSIARGHYDEPCPMVLELLESGDRGEKEAVLQASTTADLLWYLPAFCGDGSKDGCEFGAKGFVPDMDISLENSMWSCKISARTLHQLFQRMRRDAGLRYTLGSMQRLGNELAAIEHSLQGTREGMDLSKAANAVRRNGRRERLWTIIIDVSRARSLPAQADLDLEGESDGEDIPF